MAVAKKTRGPRKVLTVEELKQAAIKAQVRAKEMLRKAYAAELASHVKAFEGSLATLHKGAYAKFGQNIDDIGILTAIGKQIGIKRLVVTQSAPIPRKPKETKQPAPVPRKPKATK